MPRPRQRTLYMSSHRPPVYGRDLSTHLKCVAITFIAGLCVCAPLGANPGRYKYTADLLRLDQPPPVQTPHLLPAPPNLLSTYGPTYYLALTVSGSP